jgi:hypothetical protein
MTAADHDAATRAAEDEFPISYTASATGIALTKIQRAAYEKGWQAATRRASERCPHCGTHETRVERTCHNSACAKYGEPQCVHEGWAPR